MSEALTTPVRTDAARRSKSSQVRRNQLFVWSTGDKRRERRPGARRVEGIEPSLGEVRNARGELEAEQMGECEDMVADPSAVGVMGGDGEIGLVVEQAIDDVRRLAGSGIATVW